MRITTRGHQSELMSGLEKNEQGEHIQHSSIKHVTGMFLEVSRCSRRK